MTTVASARIATDFSDEAGAAVRRAASIAKETGLRGVLAHVLPYNLLPAFHVQAASQAQQALALLAGEAEREGLRFEARLLSGDITGELAQAASEFDLVVAGAHGTGPLLDFALGRTSTRLVRRSPRPGYPTAVIVDRARQVVAELIVVGKHAAGIVEQLLIGSVALQVLERAHCDVLVVPEGAA